jgi:hypothetical protein
MVQRSITGGSSEIKPQALREGSLQQGRSARSSIGYKQYGANSNSKLPKVKRSGLLHSNPFHRSSAVSDQESELYAVPHPFTMACMKLIEALQAFHNNLQSLDKKYTWGWALPMLITIVKGIIYGGIIQLCLLTRIRDFASFWPPNGVAVGFCLTSKGRHFITLVPFLIVVLFVVNIMRNSVTASIFFTLINTIESALCYLFIVKYSKTLNLGDRRTAIVIVLGCFVAALVGGVLGAAFIIQYFQQPWDLFRIQAFRWFTSDGLGMS